MSSDSEENKNSDEVKIGSAPEPIEVDVAEQKTSLELARETDSRFDFEEFIDERILVSHDVFGKKEMKIKILSVSDELPPRRWKFGDRVKVNKVLVTIKHIDTQQVEEEEFDIEAIERELTEKRHYTSSNRWIPTEDVKNGYVVNSRHTTLISGAAALDYIEF